MKDRKAVKGKERVQIWLTRKTLKALDKEAKHCGVTRSVLIELKVS